MNRFHAGWAIKIWVLLTVFVLPFLDRLEIAGWVAIGAVLGVVWKVLPEGPPEKPVEPLPFHDQYKDKQIPLPPGHPGRREGGDGPEIGPPPPRG